MLELVEPPNFSPAAASSRYHPLKIRETLTSLGKLAALLSMVGVSACSVFGIRSGYEHLEYRVEESFGDVEIRQYKERLVAEVRDAPGEDEAFRILFKYISGENTSSDKLSMTAPVEVGAGAEIAMTVPVEVSDAETKRISMRFFLPAEYSAASIPKPLDARVSIVTLPPAKVAALGYSGTSDRVNFRLAREKLLRILQGSRWKPIGSSTFLGYDPPFTLPFFRRNEVITEIRLSSDTL